MDKKARTTSYSLQTFDGTDIDEQPFHLDAYTNLFISDVGILTWSEVEISAGLSVTINPEFHAWLGSDVHIYIEDKELDCSDPSYKLMPNTNESIVPSLRISKSSKVHSVELRFQPPDITAFAWPNPFTDRLHFRTPDPEGVQLELLDGLGRSVQTLSVSDQETILMTKDLSPGNLLLQATSGSGTIATFSLIKLP